MLRALLLENLHPQATGVLTSAGVEVTRRHGALDEDELEAALDGVQVLGIRSKTNVSRRVLENTPDLLAVGAYCIGTNQIDVTAAAERGVAVFNAPFSNTRSVVELAIGEIIALTRRLTERDKALHAGVWDKSATGAHEIRGRTLGIVGYGNIGSQLSVVAEALGMRVIFFDTEEKLVLGNARRVESMDEIFSTADIVSLHVDGRPGNAGLVSRERFSRMRPGSLFLNLSRGFLVDYAALRESIISGQIAGAAVDVFPVEPKSQGDSFDSDLRGLPNVILTPHIGGSTEEAQESIGLFVSTKLRDYVTHGTTALSVNLPPLSLEPSSTHAHRIAHLHRNTPGVLALVNRTFAEHGANIEGQMLSTRGELGYAVTDIGSGLPDDAVATLEAMPETIRLRVIH